MTNPVELSALTEAFRSAGAPHPESWARSQIEEGINQFHRYLFLRQAWSQVVGEDDVGWIDSSIKSARADPTAPFSGVGQSLERILGAGASQEDVTELVRGMQATLLFNLCYLLEDPSFLEPELAEIGWCLVETDPELEPTEKTIGTLHESVLETDPTGREMRPRPRP